MRHSLHLTSERWLIYFFQTKMSCSSCMRNYSQGKWQQQIDTWDKMEPFRTTSKIWLSSDLRLHRIDLSQQITILELAHHEFLQCSQLQVIQLSSEICQTLNNQDYLSQEPELEIQQEQHRQILRCSEVLEVSLRQDFQIIETVILRVITTWWEVLGLRQLQQFQDFLQIRGWTS